MQFGAARIATLIPTHTTVTIITTTMTCKPINFRYHLFRMSLSLVVEYYVLSFSPLKKIVCKKIKETVCPMLM